MVNRGLKSGTVSVYGSAVRGFMRWFDALMAGEGLGVCDMTEDMWILYVSYESIFVSSASISAKLSALKEHYMLRFGVNPFLVEGRVMHRLGLTRREIKLNESAENKRYKLSVTKEVLRDGVKGYLDLRHHDDRVVWAICCVGVACLLRLSEVTWTGRKQEKKLVRREALGLGEHRGVKRGELRLDDTKTKLHGDLMKCSFYKDGSSVCPWEAVTAYLEGSVVELAPGEALFRWSNGKVVRAREFNKKMRAILERGGVSMDEYAGFSLRRGGALSMALAGVPDRTIRAVGRWKSYAYRIYLDLTEQEKADAQLKAAHTQSEASWAKLVRRCGRYKPDEAWYEEESAGSAGKDNGQ